MFIVRDDCMHIAAHSCPCLWSSLVGWCTGSLPITLLRPRLNRGIGLLLTPVPQFDEPITVKCQCNFNGLTGNWATRDQYAAFKLLTRFGGACAAGFVVC